MLQNTFEQSEQNIIKFKTRIVEEQQKVPSQNKEVQEMKINGITIFKNKKCNTWYTRYRKNGKQYYLSGKTQKEVAEKLKEALDIKRKENLPYNTFEKWYNKWLNLFKIGKVKVSTLKVYKTLMMHIPDNVKEMNIKNISALLIQEVLNQTPGERTPQKLYEFLKDIFASALKFDIIKSNPMDKITKPEHVRENGQALTLEHQQKFLAQCKKEKYGDIFIVCLYMGLRRGELTAFEGKDITSNGLIINKSLNSSGEIDTTKNKYSNRIVPIFEPVKPILDKYKGCSGRVFNISGANVLKVFKEVLSRAGLPDTYTVHSLRHTFITNCKNENIPEHIIQRWVGHQIGSKVTSTVYTHAQNEANLIYINKLNKSKFYSNSTLKK